MLESTTWPGTTREVLQPILEAGSGLKVGEGFYLAMSPERVDPGREDWTTKTTPKVLGGITPECTKRAAEVYRRAIDTVVEVSTPEAAELTKLLENIFRSVNIALVNELAQLCDRMNDRRLGGRRRGGDEAVRLHAASARAPASAATASRSIRSISPGRRASSASTPSSSSSPARSTRRCRTSAARSSRRR